MEAVLFGILGFAVVVALLIKFAIDHRRAERATTELESVRPIADPSQRKKDEDR